MLFKKLVIKDGVVYKRVSWPDEILVKCKMCDVKWVYYLPDPICEKCMSLQSKLNTYTEDLTYIFDKEI